MSTPGGSGGLSAGADIRLNLPAVDDILRKLTEVRDILMQIQNIGSATGMMGAASGITNIGGVPASAMPTTPTPYGMSAASPTGAIGPPQFNAPPPATSPQVTVPLMGTDVNGNPIIYGWNHAAQQYQPAPGGFGVGTGGYGGTGYGGTGGGNYGGIPASSPVSTTPSDPNITQQLPPGIAAAFNPNVTQQFNPNTTQQFNPNTTQQFNPNVTQSTGAPSAQPPSSGIPSSGTGPFDPYAPMPFVVQPSGSGDPNADGDSAKAVNKVSSLFSLYRAFSAAGHIGSQITRSTITGEPAESIMIRDIPSALTLAGTGIGELFGNPLIGGVIGSTIGNIASPITNEIANKITGNAVLRGQWGNGVANSLDYLSSNTAYAIQGYSYSTAQKLLESGMPDADVSQLIRGMSPIRQFRESVMLSPEENKGIRDYYRDSYNADNGIVQRYSYRTIDAERAQDIVSGWYESPLTRGYTNQQGGIKNLELGLLTNEKTQAQAGEALLNSLPTEALAGLIKNLNALRQQALETGLSVDTLNKLIGQTRATYEAAKTAEGARAVAEAYGSEATTVYSSAMLTGNVGNADVPNIFNDAVASALDAYNKAKDAFEQSGSKNPNLRKTMNEASNAYASAKREQSMAAGEIQEAQGQATYAQGQAEFQRSYYSGDQPSDSMFQMMRAGLTTQISGVQDEIDRRVQAGQGNSPEVSQLRAKLAGLQYQQNVGLRIQEEGLVWGEKEAAMRVGTSSYARSQVMTELTGTEPKAVEAANSVQLNVIQQRILFLDSELTLRQGISKEQRESLEAEKNQLEVDGKRLEFNMLIGIEQAKVGVVQRASNIAAGQAQLVLGAGAGGLAGLAEMAKSEAAAANTEEAKEAYLDYVTNTLKLPKGNKIRDDAEIDVVAAKQQVQEAHYAKFAPPVSAATQAAGAAAGLAETSYRLSGADPATQQLADIKALLKSGMEQHQIVGMATDDKSRAVALGRESEIMSSTQQAMESYAHPVTPLSQVVAKSEMDARLQIARMTYAGQQAIRGITEEQLSLKQMEMQRLIKRRSQLEQMGPNAAEALTGVKQQIYQTAVSSAGYQHELEEGFMDRLISQAYNTPSNGMLATSGFTNREASMFYGIYHQAFGGTQQQMEFAKSGFNRYLQNMGTNEAVLSGMSNVPYSQIFPRGATTGSSTEHGLAPDAGMRAVQPNVAINIYIDGRKINPDRVDMKTQDYSTSNQRTLYTSIPQQPLTAFKNN